MAKGGKRPGAGRPKGAATRRTREIADKAIAEGLSPLEVMLENMRYFHEEAGKRLAQALTLKGDELIGMLKLIAGYRESAQNAARDAAPYIHPKLAAVEHTGEDGGPITYKVVTGIDRG